VAASTSDRELQALLAGSNSGPLPALSSGSLAQSKLELAQAIEVNGAAFSSKLRSERSALLTNSIPGTLRVLLGALIVSAILFTITLQHQANLGGNRQDPSLPPGGLRTDNGRPRSGAADAAYFEALAGDEDHAQG
jgi:hypothetical protein